MIDINLISTSELASLAPDLDTSRYNDPTLSGLISMASKMVTQDLGYSPVAEVITDELRKGHVDTNGDLVVLPVKLPVISVTAIKISKGSTELTLNLTKSNGDPRYDIDWQRRTIRYPYSEISTSGDLIIVSFMELRNQHFYTKTTYRAGFEAYEIPSDIRLATIYFMREILARGSNTFGATKLSQGGISIEYSDKDGDSDNVRDARKLLRPYRRIT